MRTRHFRSACSLVVVVAVLLLAAAPAGAEEKSRMDVVLERGKLIVVTLGTTPPFAFNDDKGELVGFDVDICRLVAEALFKDEAFVKRIATTGSKPAFLGPAPFADYVRQDHDYFGKVIRELKIKAAD